MSTWYSTMWHKSNPQQPDQSLSSAWTQPNPAGGEVGAGNPGNRLQPHLRIRRHGRVSSRKRENLACTPTGCLPVGVPGAGSGWCGGVDDNRCWKSAEGGASPREDENHTDNLTRGDKITGDLHTTPKRWRFPLHYLLCMGDTATGANPVATTVGVAA